MYTNSIPLRCNFLILTLLLSVLNCSKDKEEECISTRIAYVSQVNGPDFAQLNTEVAIAASFNLINGCGSFDQFLQSGTPKNRIIEIQAKYKGCVCTQNVTTVEKNYIFKADEVGVYQLNFKSRESGFITLSITVVE